MWVQGEGHWPIPLEETEFSFQFWQKPFCDGFWLSRRFRSDFRDVLRKRKHRERRYYRREISSRSHRIFDTQCEQLERKWTTLR